MLSQYLSLFFILPVVLGCGRSQPVSFRPGEYRCEFCQMDIIDMRFKAEILTPKGKVHRFDSVECMMSWWLSHRGETASRWVTDFYRPEIWIAMEKAFVLKSDRLASPMGAFLSAYASGADGEKARREYGGTAMDLKELEAFIERQWKKGIPGEEAP